MEMTTNLDGSSLALSRDQSEALVERLKGCSFQEWEYSERRTDLGDMYTAHLVTERVYLLNAATASVEVIEREDYTSAMAITFIEGASSYEYSLKMKSDDAIVSGDSYQARILFQYLRGESLKLKEKELLAAERKRSDLVQTVLDSFKPPKKS